MKAAYAALILLLLAGGGLWLVVSRTEKAQASLGSGAASRAPSNAEPPAGSEIDDSDPALIEKLSALGYLAGYRPAPSRSGVQAYDAELAQPGYNLVVSGHAPHAALIDLRGGVLHSWTVDPPDGYPVPPERRFWRRVHLLDDGALLAIFDPFGIVKLDRDSRLLWATNIIDHLHHDLFVTADDRIWSLGKRYRKIPRLHPTLTFGEDMVVVLEPDGRVVERMSILEAFVRSPFAEQVEESIRSFTVYAQGESWEDFHANTIEILDGALAHLSPVFAAGNIVSCSPHLGNVFIIDPATRSVVWNWFGPWQRIHEPQVLPGGRLLLFHNNGHHQGARSQALEYDLLGRELVWSYDGREELPETRFFSGTSSTVQRLANGNTLIVVTESGRAIEVTPDGGVAWEFLNPEWTGAEGELIASLFQLERVSRERVEPWLDRLRTSNAHGH